MPKEPTQRRVYVLPNELVERIVRFQTDKGLPSEVEAVRRLLDEALMHRDTSDSILKRLEAKMRSVRIPSDAAKEVLVGHPLVKEINFHKNDVIFKVEGYGSYKLSDDGSIYTETFDGWDKWEEIPF